MTAKFLATLGIAALLACAVAEAQRAEAHRPAHWGTSETRPSRWVSGELLVGFRAGVGPGGRHALYRKHGADFLEDIGQQSVRIVRIRVPAAYEEAVMVRLARRPEVKFVEKNYEYTPALVPDDPEYAYQWHLPMIHAPEAWDLSQGGSGAIIAILDSGVDATQPDLAAKLVAGYNTFSNTTDTSDAFGHGTEVAGVAGALTNNAVGVAGVASASPIMPVRVTNATGGATAASIANGIIWAADHGARVINLSFNGVAGNATIRTAAEYAYNHGTLVVAASGNCGCADPTAETPFMLSVSATDESDAFAYFSTTGPFVDLSAPGNNILTTAKFGLYLAESGTSLASPVVAGVAALMFSANPALTPSLTTQLLEATAFDLGNVGYDQNFGYGRVDAYAAVSAAAGYTPPPDATPPTVAMTAPAAGATVSGTAVVSVAASDNVGVVKVDLYVDGVYYVTDTTSPYSFAWDTTALPNGAHSLQAVASDAAGNGASTAPISVTVANTPPDTTAPTVSISSPTAGATVSGTITVAANAADNVGVKTVDFFVDGAFKSSDTTAPYSFLWNTTTMTGGSHMLVAVASDAAGNSASATTPVTVANNQPPVAVNDAYTAPYRRSTSYTARVYAVLSNDSDADGSLNVASVALVDAPNKGGTVQVRTNGTVAYTPSRGYRGVETFRYSVKDNLGATSNTATVTVTVY